MTSLPTIDAAMQEAIRDGVFPAAELLVGNPDRILHHNHYGDCHPGSLFDIASLTKPVCTTTLAMVAVAEGKLSLTDKLAQRILIPQHPSHEKIQLYHLLQHSSGLPAHRKYYLQMPPQDVGKASGRDWILNACSQEPCERPVGQESVYSDIGFILLGCILEEAMGAALDKLFAQRIAKSLRLQSTFFIPSPSGGGSSELPLTLRQTTGGQAALSSARGGLTRGERERILPTQNCPWRGRIIQGENRDENCYAMGGVAGHAGLFSQAQDLHLFAKAFAAAAGGATEFLNPDVVRSFIAPTTPAPQHPNDWVLGWHTPSLSYSSAGQLFSRQSIGHTGYTGCSLWIDLEKKFWVILLSNRSHPSAENTKIRDFRPKIHNLIVQSLRKPA